ncbi:hypothetical protein HMPREF9454_01478 [Megamonas funiformis YIT 11815]|jgi:anaerobic C4-dicarboxylate transporter DcuB|uniref:Uncharacterized protein n=3 Tax=Megamonas funiformis TaxID=437897 RepID=A0ABN0EHS9_9FIRM|nr:hypothetical protein HMPREF9454_01478 [Megamonas funiformis YIT 11815]
MVAIVSVYGVAWMAETYFGAYLPEFKETLGQIVLDYPWTYAIVLFLISKLLTYSPCLNAGDSWIKTILAY